MKWLTAALLTVAAVLAGLLVYRSAAPGRGGLRGGTALDTPLAVPPLPLTDDRGRPTTLAASDGRLRLVFFGYARCPDVCPVTLAGLERSTFGVSFTGSTVTSCTCTRRRCSSLSVL